MTRASEPRRPRGGSIDITVGAYVQRLGLHYVVIAWDEHAAGCTIYYDFFESFH